MTMGERIRFLRKKNKMTQEALGKLIGVQRSAIRKYEHGEVENIPRSSIQKMAEFFNVSPSYLMGFDDQDKSNIETIITDNIYMAPLFESVSAGFGAFADDQIVDYIPCLIYSKSEAKETICIRVTGDSMYPKIEDGDIIQVHKQSSVDNGDIAVLLIDQSEGVVKKVVYDENTINLISINPMYPIRSFSGRDVLRVSVVGKVRKIIKDV